MGITKKIKNFENGSKVVVMPRSTNNRSVPHPRYKGRIGIVLERRGDSYVVEISLSK